MRAVRYQPAHRRTRRRGPVAPLVILVVVVVVAALVLIRAETVTVPDLRVDELAATSARFPGAVPTLAWPSHGQAAVAVVGVGHPRSSGAQTPQPIASVAKMMTAYLVLRDHPLAPGRRGFGLKVSATDVADYQSDVARAESTVPVTLGEELDEHQLLEALLIPSGNNIAELLARYDAGSEKRFVAKMNAAAGALGMSATTYTDPSGFEATTRSTASDQVALAEAAIRNPVFDSVIAMRTVTLPIAGRVPNFDTLLGHHGFVGIKTGSDSEAGGCFVFADHLVVAGRSVTLVGAILGLDRGQMVTATLLKAALAASSRLASSVGRSLATRTVVPTGTLVARITNAAGRQVAATTAEPLRTLGWGGMTVPLRLELHRLGRHLDHGQSVAALTLEADPPQTTSAGATSAMPSVSFGWRLHHLF